MSVETVPVAPAPVVKVKKSPYIVALLNEKGLDLPANDVIETLKAQGVDGVTAQLINNIKHRLRANKAAKARKRGKRVAVPVETAPQSEFDQMLAVKALATTVGGFDKLSELVEKCRKLVA